MRGFSVIRFVPLLLLGLSYGLMVAPTGLYNAEFLTGRGFTAETAGHMYVFASVISILLLTMLPAFLSRWGARSTLIRLTLLVFLGSLGLGFFSSYTFTFVAFLLFVSVQILIYSLLDLFVEAKVDGLESITGRVRGLYLTLINLAFTMGPFIAGWVITHYSFNHLYLFAAVMALLFLVLVSSVTRKFRDAAYPQVTPIYVIRLLLKNRTFATIWGINFLLQLRYAVVVVYLAIYLHQVLGFSLGAVGLMVTIANIPFILLQFPLGTLSDRWFGEKEMLVAGFVMTCFGGFMLAFTATTSIPVMTAILMLMFTGAAAIEIMSESYFFKHVKAKDDAYIVAFRMVIPLAYIVAPLIAGGIMLILPMNYNFAAVAAICLLGIPLALSLKDTH